MGWFDGGSEVGSSHSHRKSSRHHSHSHHSSPRGSAIFGLGEPKHNASRSSFFGISNPRASSSSYYKRSPRKGYINRMYSQLRRLLRDLVYYMKKHPMKVFMLVIMPLITSGAVATLLAKFGLRLPAGIEKMFGRAAGGTRVERGRTGGLHFERTKVEGSGYGGLGEVVGGMGGIGGAVSLAKMFM